MLHQHLPESGINNVFAKALPKKRAKRDLKLKCICVIILYAVGCYLSHDPRITYYIGSTFSSCYVGLFISEIIQRLCSLVEECYHLRSRYNNCVLALLKEIFSFNQFNVVCIFCSMLYLLLTVDYTISDFGLLSWLCAILAMSIFVRIFELSWSHLNLAHQVDDLNGLDCATYMANSYFYGYLAIIVPCRGDDTKALKEHMLDYQSAQGIKFAAIKLYIFVPLSGYCAISLSDRSHKFLPDRAKNLEYNIIDRSGVRGRDYHNSVYKLKYNENKSPYYVCAEFASPLHTLFKITERSTDVSGIYKKYNREIVTKFYMALSNLINDSPEFKDLVELIFFDDLDSTGKLLDVEELDIADLLLERLSNKIIQ